MYIECKLKREGGSKVPLGNIEYHFAPQADGAHVAFVENPEHQDRFVSIPEAYRIYRGAETPAPTAAPVAATPAELGIGEHEESEAPAAQTILYGSDVHDARYTIHGKDYALGDIVALAAAGMSADDWNSLSADTRADLIDEQLDKLSEADPADTNGDGTVDASEERAALVVQYQAKFGRKPHHKLSVDKIRAELAA
jgi:hypothetical protein